MGSAYRSDKDKNAVVNQPGSGKLRQSTSVSSQCENFS